MRPVFRTPKKKKFSSPVPFFIGCGCIAFLVLAGAVVLVILVWPTGSDLRHLVALLLDGVSARLPCGSASALTGLEPCQKVSDGFEQTLSLEERALFAQSQSFFE
ncbi:unnamed protein product [Caenorhabditis auriculariae]|uniref:Uncharacterized protein n=1 Tax=Caenorhabditis auriculariae TaxID=2777116 RepID=A0A8S1HH82_9PELO|nr:unnamed protein product [Caenorhabditis auriculariae]